VRRHDASCVVLVLGGQYGNPAPVIAELETCKTAIEERFGGALSWESGTRGRIRVRVKAGYADPDKSDAIATELAECLGRLSKAVQPVLNTLTSRPLATGAIGVEDDEDDDIDEAEEAGPETDS
jgi:hypothetical protein